MNDPTAGRRRPGAGADSAPAMPTPPKRRPDLRDEPEELSREQVAELRGILEQRRAELVSSIDGRRDEERDTGREVGDEMDEANTEGVAAMTSKLLERDVNLMREIDRALAKISEGTYGLCEGTGEPIGYSRLKLRPWARFSVAYQEEIEREERNRGGV
jgi:DnaK suppressor protein